MTIEEIIPRLPKLARVMDKNWLGKHRAWAERFIGDQLAWYEQLERDLASLETHVSPSKLITCYRPLLRYEGQNQKALFEIHGAALLGADATRLDLHVPRGKGGRNNFDVRAEILGHSLNADVKTRKDEFPFNRPDKLEEPEGVTHPASKREIIDPHDASELGIEPEPPEIREGALGRGGV